MTQVSEREARQVAEDARESGWDKPSFAKEMFLGRFRPELIHPHPTPDPEVEAKAERFLTALRTFCAGLDGSVVERDAAIPDEWVRGFADLGCFGIKIDEEYGGL